MRSLLLAILTTFALSHFAPPQTALAQELGTIEGQFLLDGKSPLADAPLLVKKGDTAVRDFEVCAQADIPDERLAVDPKTGGIANIVVYLRKKPAGMPANPPAQPLKFDQNNCRFFPRILHVQTGQTINCTSQDAVAHNLHTNPFANDPVNLLIPANSPTPTPVVMKRPENLPVKVTCDLHGWMDAYWVVTDHPYVAVTNAEGKFSISGLPPGEHAFTVWHQTGYVPASDARTLKVTVKPGKQSIPPIKVPAAHFKKRLEATVQIQRG